MPPPVRPVPDSLEEGRKIRDAAAASLIAAGKDISNIPAKDLVQAAMAARTYTPPNPHDLASVVAHREAMAQRDSTERKAVAVLEAARMKNYVIPDSLAEGRKQREERNARIRASRIKE